MITREKVKAHRRKKNMLYNEKIIFMETASRTPARRPPRGHRCAFEALSSHYFLTKGVSSMITREKVKAHLKRAGWVFSYE